MGKPAKKDPKRVAAMFNAQTIDEAPPKARRRKDGWVNAITGFGDSTRDKRAAHEVELEVWHQDASEELWRADAMMARIVEKVPKEMTRRGWAFNVKDDKDAAEAMRARQEELRIRGKIRRCLEYQRGFGGGALLLGVDDGLDVSAPLDEERIASFKFVTELTPKELVPVRYYNDPLQPNYGEPEVFELRRRAARARELKSVAATVRIHESRLIIFQGFQVVKDQIGAHVGWGDSIFVRVYNAVRDFVMANEGAATLVADFAQAIYKIKGLAELIACDEDEAIINRGKLVDYMRSTIRAILIDSEEEFERKSTSVDGLPDVLDRLGIFVAASVDMPVTVLLGRSPAGLNATGESDIRNWYDYLAGEQEDQVRDGLEKITRCIFKAADGPTSGKEPESWSIKFLPLWTMTDLEQADLRGKVATADKAYVDAGILMPEEVAESRFGGDEWSMETQIDEEIRAEHDAKEAELAAKEAEAAAKALEGARAGIPRGAPPPGVPGAKP